MGSKETGPSSRKKKSRTILDLYKRNKPKVEPYYKKDSFIKYWVLTTIIYVVLVILIGIYFPNKEYQFVVTLLFSVVVSVFLGVSGDYSFAVRLVNLMNTVGWAYYKGIAVITLSDSKLVFVDTRRKEIYFTLGGSIHQFVKHHEIRDPLKLSVFFKDKSGRAFSRRGE